MLRDPDDMRLIKQNIERKDGSGSATLLPEEPEDMVGLFVSFGRTSLLREMLMHSFSGTPTT